MFTTIIDIYDQRIAVISTTEEGLAAWVACLEEAAKHPEVKARFEAHGGRAAATMAFYIARMRRPARSSEGPQPFGKSLAEWGGEADLLRIRLAAADGAERSE